MTPPASPPSETSNIPPLRSIALLGLVTTSILVTSISSIQPSPLIPRFLLFVVELGSTVMWYSSIVGSVLIILMDQTEYRAAITSHFFISATIICVLYLSKSIERNGFKNFTMEDIILCLKLAIWTITFGMLSAIWMRGGVEGLKREAKAVLGNLWLSLYEWDRA